MSCVDRLVTEKFVRTLFHHLNVPAYPDAQRTLDDPTGSCGSGHLNAGDVSQESWQVAKVTIERKYNRKRSLDCDGSFYRDFMIASQWVNSHVRIRVVVRFCLVHDELTRSGKALAAPRNH